MAECSFRPKLSERSMKIMEKRYVDTSGGAPRAPGQKHEELYRDAQRRRKKQDEYVEWASKMYPYKPDIGVDKLRRRRNGDLSEKDFFDRLHVSGEERQRRIDKLRDDALYDSSTGQRLFQPRVGRAPNFSRNAEGLAVHDFLFASRHEYADRKAFLQDEKGAVSRMPRKRRRPSRVATSLREHEGKRISFLFESLLGSYDNNGDGDQTGRS